MRQIWAQDLEPQGIGLMHSGHPSSPYFLIWGIQRSLLSPNLPMWPASSCQLPLPQPEASPCSSVCLQLLGAIPPPTHTKPEKNDCLQGQQAENLEASWLLRKDVRTMDQATVQGPGPPCSFPHSSKSVSSITLLVPELSDHFPLLPTRLNIIRAQEQGMG